LRFGEGDTVMREWDAREKLVAKAQRGDRAAFDELALEHRRSLEDLFSREMGPSLRAKVDVEDLLQETLLRAFQDLKGFDPRGDKAFEAWLFAIARHAVQDRARYLHRKKRACDREVHLSSRSPSGQPLGNPLDRLAATSVPSGATSLRREERFDRLQAALDNLSPDHREVIQLARIEGLSMKEVAAKMNRSEAAASVLLVRAMRKLKAAFGSTESFHLPLRGLPGEAKHDD
jgi:RNA polymerase sigma-70 factor (ECF subfamily)